MPQDLIIGAKTGGSSNLLRINDTSRRFSFRDVDGSWKEAANTDFAIFEKPDEVSRFLVLELSANADYNPAATMNSQTDQANFIYYDGAAWSAFPAGGISPTALGTLVAFNFAAVAKNLGDQIFFRFWWSDGQTTTEKKASIFPAMSLANSGASSAVEVEAATDSVAGIARAATQAEVDDGTAGFIFVTPATLNAKKFAASKITGLATVATSGDYNDLINKYELPAASASARGGVKIGSNINLTSGDVISVASASTSSAGVVQLASATEVTAGTVDNKAVTPAGLKVELDKKANSADLKAVALSGSYNDLTDKPEIPEVVAASTTATGIVRLATAEEAAGELATIAVTPAGLNSVLSGYYTSTEIDNKLSVVIRYKGVKATEAELPSSENEIGDFWLVSEDSSEYVWNGTAWEKFGATISLDGYLTTEAASQTYVAKTQLATATSVGIVQIGQNININSGIISVASASVSTSGVVQLASTAEVTAGSNNFKAVTPAGLKVELDKKANLNALATVATSGDYNDLSNKYELPAATSTTIGGVKPGGNLTVTADGTLNFTGFGAQSSDGSSLSSEIKVLKAGSGTQFSYNSGVLTIGLDSSVTGGLTAVTHDSTLTGQGTSSDPLKVNVVTTVSASTDASDDKIPTELAVRNAIDSQKVTKLVLQRGASEKSLYPKIAFSASADFSSASEFDFSSNDFARSSARVFNGTGWVSFPAGGLDASYDNREVVIDVATLLGDSMPQLPFYFRFCWIEAGGTASEYKSSVFPAAPSFAPAADVVDEERLLPTGGVTGNVLKIDSSGKAIWSEGVDEARLLPELATIPEELSGHPVVYDYQSGIDADTLCLLHLDDSTWADATGKNTITQHGSVAKVSDSGYFNKALDLSGNQSSGSLSWLTIPWLSAYEAATWTIEFFAKPTKSVVNFMFFSFGNSQNSYLSLGSQSLTNLWLGNGSGTYTGNFNFSLNTWYWFVVQYDGSAVKVYVDGQLVVEGNFTPNYVGQDLQFGNLNLVNNQDNTFIGYLDEFRWSKGLRYPTGVMEVPTQPFGSSQARFKVADKKFVTVDSSQLLPTNPTNGDMAVYRKVPEDAAPQNLTSATSDSNWEVTWSGAYSGRVGWQAFDSDQSTVWCTYSAAVGDWLCWEYKGAGGKVLLRRYSIAKGSGNGDCPTGWKIQGSNDGSSWIDLDEQTGQSFPDNNAKEYTIPNNSTPYKFHRFYLLSWNTSNMIGTFKAWSWINSTDECNRWVTVDIADLQGTSENEITLVRPVSNQSLFPIIEASADVGFTSVQTINTRTVADDRIKVKVFNGSAFADFPDSGLGTPYDEQSVVIDVSSFIAVLGDSFYVRYKWESSDGTASDYKAAKFPLSVAQTPVASTGGGTGNVSYQTLEIPAQDSWTTDPDDSTRKYVSVASGRCSCIVYDANGIEVGVEVQYVSSTNETRLLIPADLPAGTITADWTCRYAQISEN